jgi:hypothetical protein
MRRTWPLVAALVLGVACELLGAPSRVRDGILYKSGDAKYDAYFSDVHDAQVDAANWDDDKRAGRKPLTTVLKLAADASDSTITEVVREEVDTAADLGASKLEVNGDDVHLVADHAATVSGSTAALVQAIEQAVRAEVAREKKIRAAQPKVETLVDTGRGLAPHILEDFGKDGSPKQREVRNELNASIDVLNTIDRQGKRESDNAESFVVEMQKAVTQGHLSATASTAAPASTADASAPPSSASAEPSSAPAPSAAPAHRAPPPKPAPAAPKPEHVAVSRPPPPPPAPKPETPPPAPKPTSTGEVFNP